MLLIYINSKLDSEMKTNKGDYSEEILKYWGEYENITLDKIVIEKLIESKKIQIYTEHMKSVINVDDYNSLEEVVKKYVDIFGENGLKELNIQMLSEALDEDYLDIFNLVNEEYTKIKKEYEMRKLEGQLFNSHASFKDMEYIDTLSGFDFEDFLKELFTEFGYTTKELPYSNDYGADLIISKGFNEIVIQAKNYSTNVGNKAVQEVIAAKSHYKCDIGMVITNAYYTQNAIKTAEASEILLVDRDGLERIISEGSIYFNSLVS